MAKKLNIKLEGAALTPGEFFDRFTILVRKAKFSSDYRKKVQEFMGMMDKAGLPGSLLCYVCSLMMTNTDIWNLESDIRKGKEGELGLKEVGERAIAIREENNKRISIVNGLNRLFGVKQKETKFDHASE